MTKMSRTIKKIINSKDIPYPHDQFPGIGLQKDDFISLKAFFEINRDETIKKYIALRDLANQIIAKDSIIQGITYTEGKSPTLSLLFRRELPINDDPKKKEGNNEENNEENKSESKLDEKKHYQDCIQRIKGYNITNSITINKNEEFKFYCINEQNLEYLLNSANLTSNLEIELVQEYIEELQRFR